MEKFESEDVDIIREDMKSAFSKIEEQRGVTIKLGRNISWDDTMFSQSLKILAGDGSSLEKKIWDQNAKFFDIPLNWFNMTFTNLNGKRCRIDGFNSKATKMPIKYSELESGRKMKTTINVIKKAMALNTDPM
jgi:hypothetical protein